MYRVRYCCVLACLLLGNCSGGPPSSGDIKAALEESAKAELKERAPIIESVTDVDCKEAQGKPGFICSFTIAFSSKWTNNKSSKINARLVQQGFGWVMMEDKR